MILYKYVRPERIDVLQHCQIRFTQPGALNDPFDLRPRFEALLSEAEALGNLAESPLDLETTLREAYDMLSAEQRDQLPLDTALRMMSMYFASYEGRQVMSDALVAVLQLLRDVAPQVRAQLFDAINRNIGILSLSDVNDDPVMWAHYADNHRGMVFAFDGSHECFNRKRSPSDEFFHVRQVLYSDSPPASSLTSLDSDAMFATKAARWSYERERRMLAPLRDASRVLQAAGDTVHLFAFPPRALLAVVVGACVGPDLEAALRDVLVSDPRYSHVALKRAELDVEEQRIRIG